MKGKRGFQKGHTINLGRRYTIKDTSNYTGNGNGKKNKGRSLSEEHKNKLRMAKLKNPVRYWLGKTNDARLVGENNHKWKGGYQNHLMHGRKRRVMKLGASGSHTLAQWEELKMEFGYRCLDCGEVEPEIRLSEEHIIPLTKGGSDDISNIQPLCRGCNSRKYNKIISYLPQNICQ